MNAATSVKNAIGNDDMDNNTGVTIRAQKQKDERIREATLCDGDMAPGFRTMRTERVERAHDKQARTTTTRIQTRRHKSAKRARREGKPDYDVATAQGFRSAKTKRVERAQW